jgi:outer membrane protein assembly factor BamE (lipoprotein component of BamABCDE complex)
MFNNKFPKNLTVIAAATGLLFLSNLAFAANGFTVQRADEAQIKVGMEKEMVRKLLGRPAHNVKYNNQPGRAWTYGVLNVDDIDSTSSTLFDVDFDANGKVLSFNERVENHHSSNSTAQ